MRKYTVWWEIGYHPWALSPQGNDYWWKWRTFFSTRKNFMSEISLKNVYHNHNDTKVELDQFINFSNLPLELKVALLKDLYIAYGVNDEV